MPANTRQLKRRIRSVKNTAQITRAMQMVAASKMRRAQQQAQAGKPFTDLFNRTLVHLREVIDPSTHPLLQEREVEKELVIVIGTDRGLCGPLNTNLFKLLSQFDSSKTDFISVGRKAKNFIAKTKRNLVADFSVEDPAQIKNTRPITRLLRERFLNGEADRVKIAFPKFINTLTQEPRIETVLPINPISLEREALEDPAGLEKVSGFGFVFEPHPQEILNELIPAYLHSLVYQIVLDARASEHSARMVAMKNATDNAKELQKDLTLEYNKARQAAITNEIAEIATAQMAMT